jgi:integrase
MLYQAKTGVPVFVPLPPKCAHCHIFRDTFAVEMLLAGVPNDQVSILLGHSSVCITKNHYSPWVRARQDEL